MKRAEFDAKQDAEKIQQAMNQCAVIQFESGAYFCGTGVFSGLLHRTNIMAFATHFVVGGAYITEVQKQLSIRGEYFQVVILGRVGALP